MTLYRSLNLTFGLLVLLCSPFTTLQAESDCIYEFNKAFASNEAGIAALQAAEKFADNSLIKQAEQQYSQAIDLFQEAIDLYTQLPDIVHDCSATNLSIAKNNIRTANENIQLAKASSSGLRCLEKLSDVEQLNKLANDYFYKQQDIPSAQSSASDALIAIETLQNAGLCQGEYHDTLLVHQDFTRKLLSSLNSQAQHSQCDSLIRHMLERDEQARNTVDSQAIWDEVIDTADKIINSNACDAAYTERVKRHRKQAVFKKNDARR